MENWEKAAREEMEHLSRSPIFMFMSNYHYEDLGFDFKKRRVTSDDLAEIGKSLVRVHRLEKSQYHRWCSTLNYLRLLVQAADRHLAKMESDRNGKRLKRKRDNQK